MGRPPPSALRPPPATPHDCPHFEEFRLRRSPPCPPRVNRGGRCRSVVWFRFWNVRREINCFVSITSKSWNPIAITMTGDFQAATALPSASVRPRPTIGARARSGPPGPRLNKWSPVIALPPPPPRRQERMQLRDHSDEGGGHRPAIGERCLRAGGRVGEISAEEGDVRMSGDVFRLVQKLNKRGASIDLRQAIDKIPNHGTMDHF